MVSQGIFWMRIKLAAAAAALTLTAGTAFAAPTIWAVDASANGSGVSNPAVAEQFSLTGGLLRQVSLGSGFNPTGIAIVGGTAFVTSEDDGLIRTFNTTTGALGASFATGQSALGALATDGRSLFATDWTGGNQVYNFTLNGGLLGSFTATGCGSYCNGIDFTTATPGGGLVINRGQNVGPYDLYSLTGALLTSNYASAGDEGAIGISTFTNDLYAAVSGGNGGVDANGTFIPFGGTPIDTGFGAARFLNDLAVDTPEPASALILLAGLGFAALRRRQA